MQIDRIIDLLQYLDLEIQLDQLQISRGHYDIFMPMVIHKPQSSKWQKNVRKPPLCSIWYRSVSPILCKGSFRTSETCSATKYVYFRSCIIRQWLRIFFYLVSSHNELLLLFSSKQGKPSSRPGGEVWIEEQLFGNTLSKHSQISLAAQHPDPLHIPKHIRQICFPPAISLWIICVLSEGAVL